MAKIAPLQSPIGDSTLRRLSSSAATAAAATRAGGKQDVRSQFEALMLQTFVEAMLPKDTSHVFGKGIAGSTWKSMMAEMIAKEVVRSEQLGLTRSIPALGEPKASESK